ncbi:MAG: UDP-3-O-(3-hydroxymyristoyl)glucosamine N-acyltransferase [Spirosomataceae bacterium]
MEFSVKQIAQLLGGEVKGDASLKVKQLAKIEEATTGCISFLSNLKYEHFLYTTSATAVIVDRGFEPKQAYTPSLILVDNAYSAFTTLLEEYQRIVTFSKMGIEEPAYLGKDTVIGDGAYRAAFSYVGNRCTIGQNVKIYPHAYIGDNVVIGNNTVIHSGVKIYDNCVIGSFCTLKANAVIGSDGFGFAPQPDGSYKAIPQLGNVIIEDNVSVGANTTIDCATMGSTIIRQGVKLDNLIQIAHNVEIGKNTVIAAQTGISGSTKIGENCMIAGQVGIVGHIQVPNGTKITAKSGISKTFRKENMVMGGIIAVENTENLRIQAALRKLPQLMQRVNELESILKTLNLPIE